jgi:hypothetical protein
VDDEVERGQVLEEVLREGLDAGRVAQVEPVDLEALAEVVEVGLAGEAHCGVTREARGHDHPRAGAQQLDGRLVADLHARPGDERHAAAQVGGLRALQRS